MGDVFDELDGLEVLAWKKKGARCQRGNHEVPLEDKQIYEETGMCSWCAQMDRHDP